jgi:Fic family protein
MARDSGTYVSTTTLGETVRAFVPRSLPPAEPELSPLSYELQNRAAEVALARLSAVSGLAPSVEWLLYGAVRKEALLTSQIEGTQATLADLFDQEAGLDLDNRDDVEEVTNYMRAFRMVRHNLHDPHGLPLSVRLICDAHRILLDGARGANKQPGELRRSQNWIGGSRPGNAVFVPPPPEQVLQLLGDLERFIHAESPRLPPLVVIALVHAQFETIHPFLDGNGRIGRLLITALLEQWRLLKEPLLYLSGYLKRNQTQYYRLLTATRTSGAWEEWVSFFLTGVTEAAAEAERNVVDVATLVTADRRRLLESSKANGAVFRLFERLPMMPRFTVEKVRQELATSYPTANAAVKLLTDLGIVVEMSGMKKYRTFGYQSYIELLARSE